MASTTYLKNRVKHALSTLGTTGVFTVVSTAGTYDDAEGEITGEVTTTQSVRCSAPVDYQEVYRNTDAMGKMGRALVYCEIVDLENATFTPTTSMRLTLAGKSLSVLSVREYIFKSTIIAYELEVDVG